MLYTTLLISAAIAPGFGRILRRATCPDGSTVSNAACCAFKYLKEDLQENLFYNQCNAAVHQTLRATFHDAIGFSPTLGGGGADGSLIEFGPSVEFGFRANRGLDKIALTLKDYADKHNVSYGDIIQFGAAVGLGNCPGAPQLTALVGRPPAKEASPPDLVPMPTDSVDKILDRMGDAGISVADTIWLLASHSVASQRFVNPDAPGAPFDSTPGKFDTQFYLEALLNGRKGNENPSTGLLGSPVQGTVRIASDFGLARDNRTACLWQLAVGNQTFINGVFVIAMQRMSVIGVPNPDDLVDCTEVITEAPPNTLDSAEFPPTLSGADFDPTVPNICGSDFSIIGVAKGPAVIVPPVAPFSVYNYR